MENDFWKEKLNYYQQINMTKKNHEILHVNEALEKIEEFSKKFPAVHTELNRTDSSVSWEAFLSSSLKLRFYLQSQIKISFMQKIDGIFTKIADARFPYEPFGEIEQIFSNADKLLGEFNASKIDERQLQMKQKITYEFIKANLSQKLNSKLVYHVDCRQNDFLLVIENFMEKENSEKTFVLTSNNFLKIIDEILSNKEIASNSEK